jgi:phytol kinase
MIHPWLGIAFVIGTFFALLQVLSEVQKRGSAHTEMVRKALHLVMGTITLTFPWLFNEAWPVLLLSTVSGAFLIVLKVAGQRLPWYDVACKTKRKSCGEILFPVAVGLLFVLSNGSPLLFCIPMLILTFADSTSALIGMSYGKKKYNTADGIKTTEGSLAFFTIAFLATHIPLLLFSNVGRFESLAIAFIIGILGMMFEGLAWRGLDNLFIPIGTYVVLKSHLTASTEELLIRLIAVSSILAFSIVWRHHTTLNGGAILGVALYSYYSWVLGGLAWTTLPLIMFATYRQLLPQRFHDLENKHSIYGVITVASTGLPWLVFAAQMGSEHFLFPYALAFSVHASIITIAHMRSAPLTKLRTLTLLRSVMQSWCLFFGPLMLLHGITDKLLLDITLAPFIIAVPTVAYYFLKPRSESPYNRSANWQRWLRQAALAAAGSSIGLLPCFSLIH